MRTEESVSSPFLEALKRDIRLRGYSIRTEKTYLYYIRSYIHFMGKRHPEKAGTSEVKAFLSHLACDRNIAINTTWPTGTSRHWTPH